MSTPAQYIGYKQLCSDVPLQTPPPPNCLRYNAPAMLPANSTAGALYHELYTQSGGAGDGRNYRPKHVELTVIINKICNFDILC